MTRRATDRGPWRALWGRARGLTTTFAVALAAWAVITTHGAVRDIEREGVERRDQTCRISENNQAADVEQLQRTYDFLLHPPPGLKELVPIALAQLSQVESEAREDDAPPFCDEFGVGLPEPDPVLPRRPPGLPSP